MDTRQSCTRWSWNPVFSPFRVSALWLFTICCVQMSRTPCTNTLPISQGTSRRIYFCNDWDGKAAQFCYGRICIYPLQHNFRTNTWYVRSWGWVACDPWDCDRIGRFSNRVDLIWTIGTFDGAAFGFERIEVEPEEIVCYCVMWIIVQMWTVLPFAIVESWTVNSTVV